MPKSPNVEYRMCAIITPALYIYYPTFEDYFFFIKEIFTKNIVLTYG